MKVFVGLILAALVVAIAWLLGTFMLRDPGLVVLSYDGHMIETSLWFFLLVSGLLLLAVWLLFKMVFSLLSSHRLLGRWNRRRRLKGSKRQTEQGLLLMAEEEWTDARKSLVSGAKGAAAPLLNFMQAAYASNELGQIKRRNELLKKAADSTPGSQFAVDLAAARMQIDGDGSELDAGIETLLALREQAPRHQIVAEFLARGYERKEDYSALESQLGSLKRMRKEHPEDVTRMEIAIARHKLLGAYRKDADAAGALALWRRQEKPVRLNADFVTEVATTLAAGGATSEAGEILADALDENWGNQWLNHYANLPGIEQAQAGQAKSWLKSHGDDALVQLMAARGEAASGNWQAAQTHAQKSQELLPSAAAAVELARCAQALGEDGTEAA